MKFIKKYLSVLLPVFIALLLYGIPLLSGHSGCQVRELIGMPCPACGMTRAWQALFRLQIGEALFYHPLLFYPPLVCIMLWLHFIRHKKIPAWLWGLLLVIFLGVYAIRMILYFPDTAPLDFNKDAFLPRLVARIFSVWY